jgi:hypothetical protein
VVGANITKSVESLKHGIMIPRKSRNACARKEIRTGKKKEIDEQTCPRMQARKGEMRTGKAANLLLLAGPAVLYLVESLKRGLLIPRRIQKCTSRVIDR